MAREAGLHHVLMVMARGPLHEGGGWTGRAPHFVSQASGNFPTVLMTGTSRTAADRGTPGERTQAEIWQAGRNSCARRGDEEAQHVPRAQVRASPIGRGARALQRSEVGGQRLEVAGTWEWPADWVRLVSRPRPWAADKKVA